MYRKDQVKGVVALITFGAIIVSYVIGGKELAKFFAIGGFIVWLGTMYFLNKKKKPD